MKSEISNLKSEISPSLPSFPSVQSVDPKKALARHEKNIRTFVRGARKGAAEMYGYAYLSGREMLAAKEVVDHGNKDAEGGFQKWLEDRFPDLEYRTCARWMTFAKDVDTKAPALPEFTRTPLQLTNSKITKKGREAILELIPQLMDGKTMTTFMRDSKLAKEPEHQTHTPPAELTPDEKVAAEIAAVEAHLNSAIEHITIVTELSPVDQLKVAPLKWEALLNACMRLTPLARDLSKSRRGGDGSSPESKAKAKSAAQEKLKQCAAARWKEIKSTAGVKAPVTAPVS